MLFAARKESTGIVSVYGYLKDDFMKNEIDSDLL